jgi:hypothetical protein
MSHYTQIVQVKRNSHGEISIGGLISTTKFAHTDPCLTLVGMKRAEQVLESLAFRRPERRPDHWYGYTHLLDASHIKQDDAHRYRLLLEIPIYQEPPYVDLLPCGMYGTSDGHFTVYILHTNARVQVKDTGEEFDGDFFMSWLQEENEHLHKLVLQGILKYHLDSNDPDI